MIKFKFPNIHPKYSFETKPNCKHENIFKMKRNAKLLSNELLTKKNTKCVVRAQATRCFRLFSSPFPEQTTTLGNQSLRV